MFPPVRAAFGATLSTFDLAHGLQEVTDHLRRLAAER